jgi:hypothetical protein
MTREMLRQVVSCLGYDVDSPTAQKKFVQKGSYLTPDAYDLRVNSDERKNLQTAQAPR